MEVTDMVAGIKVTPESLHSNAATVNSRAGDVEGIQKGLNSQLGGLVGGEWAGNASAQFDSLWQKYNQGAQQMIEALRGIGTLLNNAGTAYHDAETAIAKTFTT
jgi:WXG100 family type VII secretion target